MPLFIWNNKLLEKNGKLAVNQNCCCESSSSSGSNFISSSSYGWLPLGSNKDKNFNFDKIYQEHIKKLSNGNSK